MSKRSNRICCKQKSLSPEGCADFAQQDRRLAELANVTDSERTKLTSLATDFQSQFSAAQENRSREFAQQVETAIFQIRSDASAVQQRLSELATEISGERTRLTSLASEFQSQFSASQEARSREFAEVQSGRQERFGTLIAEYNQRLSDQNAEFSKRRDAAFQNYEANISALNQKCAESAAAILDKMSGTRRKMSRNSLGSSETSGLRRGTSKPPTMREP